MRSTSSWRSGSSEPPYDIDLPGNRFKVTTKATRNLEIGVGILPKPYQQPRPEIVGTVVAPFSKGVIAMGQRDFHPLSANFLLDKWLPSHWQNYSEGKAKASVAPDPADWRIARTVCVADDDKTALAYGRTDPKSPYRFYYSQIMAKIFRAERQRVFKEDETQPDSEITLDYVVDKLVICGSVNKVVDEILAFHDRVGPFGELVYAGMDWVDPRARTALDGADGDRGHAARERRAGAIRGGGRVADHCVGAPLRLTTRRCGSRRSRRCGRA